MSNNHADPTANAAIGAIQKEWKKKEAEAKRLAALRKKGLLSPEAEAAARSQFRGIYRGLLKTTFQ